MKTFQRATTPGTALIPQRQAGRYRVPPKPETRPGHGGKSREYRPGILAGYRTLALGLLLAIAGLPSQAQQARPEGAESFPSKPIRMILPLSPGLNRLASAADVQFNTVSYKGASQALTDVIGGSVDAAFLDIAAALPLVESGKLRALAVTSPSRSALLPEVRTVREAMPALHDFDFGVWIGYGVRAETPEPAAKLLESALLAILRSPEYQAFNRTNGNPELIAGDGASLSRQIEVETEQLKNTLAPRR